MCVWLQNMSMHTGLMAGKQVFFVKIILRRRQCLFTSRDSQGSEWKVRKHFRVTAGLKYISYLNINLITFIHELPSLWWCMLIRLWTWGWNKSYQTKPGHADIKKKASLCSFDLLPERYNYSTCVDFGFLHSGINLTVNVRCSELKKIFYFFFFSND